MTKACFIAIQLLYMNLRLYKITEYICEIFNKVIIRSIPKCKIYSFINKIIIYQNKKIMKKIMKYFMFLLLTSAVIFAGCSKDDDDPTPAPTSKFETLKDYMIANNMDVDVVISGWITDAAAVNENGTETYHIMDIRGIDDYNTGHIAGAVHSSLTTIVADAAVATKPILVVCYTGQSAGHGVIALRLSGYADAKVLKWGMSGWNLATSGPWASNTGNTADEFR